ncbi:hypothetical protein JOM56_004003 [Amanita muscaria]
MMVMVPAVIRRDDSPKIAGSSAGFIALIVCLIVIFLVSTSAIVYLLRNERSANNLKGYANRRRRRTEQRAVVSASSGQHPQSWAKLLIPFFHFGRAPANSPPESTSSKPTQDGRGWYQTGSGDSWDYTNPQLAEAQRPTAVPYSYPNSSRSLSSPPSMDYHEQGSSRSTMPTVSEHSPRSIMAHHEISESHKPPSALPSASLHSDRDSPSLYPALLSSRVFFSSPSPSPSPTSTPVGGSTSPRLAFVDLRERSPTPQRTDSPGGETNRRTFEGGSKFLEAL